MTTFQILRLAMCVYAVLLVAVIYFTRATSHRVFGALSGAGAVALVGPGVEALAHARGWWRYPSVDTPFGPLLIYPLVVLVFAILALIGWRVTRRFGGRGLAVFLAALVVMGTLRDLAVGAWFPQFFILAPGLEPRLADAACWLGPTALALAVMRLVSGPAGGDRLARRARDAHSAADVQ